MNKFLLLVLLALPVHAVEPPEEAMRKAMLICGNRAHIARQVQVIRNTLDHSYKEYVTKVKKLYKNNAGRDEILSTGLFVYDNIPKDMELAKLFDGLYGFCMAEMAEEYRIAQLPSF